MNDLLTKLVRFAKTAMTPLFLVLALVALIIYDMLASYVKGNDATISKTALTVSNRYKFFAIILAFLFGVLFGHLFLPQHIVGP